MGRFTSENNPRKNHPNSKVRRRPADLGTTAGDARSAYRLADQVLDEEPTGQVAQMVTRLKYATDTGSAHPLPFPEGPAEQSVLAAQEELDEVQVNAAARRTEIQAELARIEAAVVAGKRNVEAAKKREYEETQRQRAREAPRRLAESRKVAEAQAREKDKVRLSEANVWRVRMLEAVKPVKQELVGVQALCDEWLGPLRNLDETAYVELPVTWSVNGRAIIARQRVTASKLRAHLVNNLDGIRATIRNAEQIAQRDAPRKFSEQMFQYNEALAQIKNASSGHTAYLGEQIVGLFNLVNEVIEREGGLDEPESGVLVPVGPTPTVAPPDRIRQNTARMRLEHIRKPINRFAPQGGDEPEQTHAERGPLP